MPGTTRDRREQLGPCPHLISGLCAPELGRTELHWLKPPSAGIVRWPRSPAASSLGDQASRALGKGGSVCPQQGPAWVLPALCWAGTGKDQVNPSRSLGVGGHGSTSLPWPAAQALSSQNHFP